MFQSPAPLAGELLGTGWKRMGSESLSLFLPASRPSFAPRASSFPGATGQFGAPSPAWPFEPSRCGQQAPSCEVAPEWSRGTGLGPLASGVRIKAPSLAPPSEWNRGLALQGCQAGHTQPPGSFQSLSLISQVVLGHECARASPGIQR